MLAVLRGDDGLGERGLEEPHLLHPLRREIGPDALQVRQKLLENLFLAHLEKRVIHRAVVAEVDEVASAILRGRAEIGMLEEAGEGIAGVADVDPVAIGHLAIKRENKALRAIRLAPLVLRAILLR